MTEPPRSGDRVFTVGHSNHPIDKFMDLLRLHGVTAVTDVRSSPYSRFAPQYSQKALKATLAEAEIAYVFLGHELGGRSTNPAHFQNGKLQYERMAEEPAFKAGLQRVVEAMGTYRMVLMCAERDPLDCHRALLVGRRLAEAGVQIAHILADGRAETQEAFESRLRAACGIPERSLIQTREQLVAKAYAVRNQHVVKENPAMVMSKARAGQKT